jgi:hypothetical protein
MKSRLGLVLLLDALLALALTDRYTQLADAWERQAQAIRLGDIARER